MEEEHIAGVHLDVDELERVLGHGQPLGVGSGLSPDLEQGKGFEPVTTRTEINNRPLKNETRSQIFPKTFTSETLKYN